MDPGLELISDSGSDFRAHGSITLFGGTDIS